MMINNAAGVTW